MIANALSALFGDKTKVPTSWTGRVPPGITIYAIGDVHGYDDALQGIHEQIDADIAQNPGQKVFEVYLADFMDRGPHSREVLEMQIARHSMNKERGIKCAYIDANHEFLFRGMLSPKDRLDWITKGFFDNGGIETLLSYGVTPRIRSDNPDGKAHQIRGSDFFVDNAGYLAMKNELWDRLPLSHANFLRSSQPMLHMGTYTFVHAAIDPTKPIRTKDQDIRLLTGISEKAREFPNYDEPLPDGRIIVRGHTVEKKPTVKHNQIGIDTGVYKEGHGKLTCAILRDQDVDFIQAKTELPPYTLKAAATSMNSYVDRHF